VAIIFVEKSIKIDTVDAEHRNIIILSFSIAPDFSLMPLTLAKTEYFQNT